jgi:hypothetical protein
MLAEDLQEADLAEPEFAEAAYDGYAEPEFGEYYPYAQPYAQQPYAQPSYGIQMPQISMPQISMPGLTRTVWSQAENRYVQYRWSLMWNRWVRVTPRMYSPYGQQGYPGMQQPYYPGQSMYPGQPAYPGMPGYPGQPGMPGMPGMPGYPGMQQGGGGRRRRRHRRR